MDPLNPEGSFIAPIHRLPAELLRSILLLCHERHSSSYWRLGCIDSRTRSIVISTPFFWTGLNVHYIQNMRRDFNSLIDKLRAQLRRCGPVLPLNIFWVTTATEHHITRLLWLFIEEKAPFNRWKTLTVYAQGVFPSEMLGQDALGEFTMLQKLYISGPHPHFFFHHLNNTRDLSNLEMVHSTFASASYEELAAAMPRVLNAVELLVIQPLSTFSSGLPPNVVALECDVLEHQCRFPHLKRLTVRACSIQPNPSDIPLVTHLTIYFHASLTDPLVLEFPALTSLVLECAIKDLRPLTWLTAPNLTSIKLHNLSKSKYLSIHPFAPPIEQLHFLRYPSVSEVEIGIQLDIAELGTLLPSFPAMQRMAIPLEDPRVFKDPATVLFDLLQDHNSVEKDGRSEIRYKDLETIQLLSTGKMVFEADDLDTAVEALMKRFPNSKLRDLRLGS